MAFFFLKLTFEHVLHTIFCILIKLICEEEILSVARLGGRGGWDHEELRGWNRKTFKNNLEKGKCCVKNSQRCRRGDKEKGQKRRLDLKLGQ